MWTKSAKGLLPLLAVALLPALASAQGAIAELRSAAETGQAAAGALDPKAAQAIASRSIDGGIGSRATRRTVAAQSAPRSAPDDEWSLWVAHEKRKERAKEGAGMAGMGLLLAAGGVLLIANPIVTFGIGAAYAGCAALMGLVGAVAWLREDDSWKERAIGMGLLGLIGGICLAAPPLGALAIIASGAACAGVGLGLMGKAFHDMFKARKEGRP